MLFKGGRVLLSFAILQSLNTFKLPTLTLVSIYLQCTARSAFSLIVFQLHPCMLYEPIHSSCVHRVQLLLYLLSYSFTRKCFCDSALLMYCIDQSIFLLFRSNGPFLFYESGDYNLDLCS